MTHESLEHELGRSEPERFNDLVTHRSRRRRGECHERHIRQHRAHRCEACIVRPKVVAPSGDAVSLVECDEREAARRIEHQEPVEQPVQRLRAQEYQLELATQGLRLDPDLGLCRSEEGMPARHAF